MNGAFVASVAWLVGRPVRAAALVGAFLVTVAMPHRALALCVGAREDGLWQNLNGNDPFRVDIEQSNCGAPGNGAPFTVTVWARQSSGALYMRGAFPGYYAAAGDGSTWIYTQYSVGGYFAHQWARWYTFYNQNYLRVWIYWESLDSKPSATTDEWFNDTVSNRYGARPLVNGQAGRCLDADPANIFQDGVAVQLFSCADVLDQNWYVPGDGTIVNVRSGKCLDADLATIGQDGTRVQLYRCWGGLNQKWNVNANGTITNAQSGRCLDASGPGIYQDGDPVGLWTCWGGGNQQWSH